MTASATFLSTRDLRKAFVMGRTRVHALAGVDIEVLENTFTVVMGPSGSGKSTLLYLLGGLDRPTGGSIQVKGYDLNALDENALAVYRRSTVGFVFQQFNLIASMTALENTAFPMRFAGINTASRSKRAKELLEMVGLETHIRHRPAEMSGGQQQRVAIARALVNDPSLILADEPTGNLDSAAGDAILGLLRRTCDEQGQTLVVVTHDAHAASYADRVIYLKDGRIVHELGPDENGGKRSTQTIRAVLTELEA